MSGSAVAAGLRGHRADLTEGERSAREERNLLRAVLASMGEGVYTIDLDGRIVSFNAAAERITGRSAGEVIGRNYVDALGLSDETGRPIAAADLPLECCIGAKQPVYRPLVHLTRPDGSRVAVALSTSPILDPLAAPAFCVAVLRDLSPDRELEELKVNLCSLVSHELRTPLGHIRGFASTLLQEDVDWDPAIRQEFLRDIEGQVARLDKLITDILDMSRMQAGAPELEVQPVAPATLVAAAADRVGYLLGEHPLVIRVPRELPPVSAEVGSMTRVLSNLLENAAKYSPAGAAIDVVGEREDHRVRLTVEDRGPGIPPADLERIFEKFVRIHHPGLPHVPGIGLGLAICRGVVEAHGGTIRAENRAGGGARFVVSLPVSTSPRRDEGESP